MTIEPPATLEEAIVVIQRLETAGGPVTVDLARERFKTIASVGRLTRAVTDADDAEETRPAAAADRDRLLAELRSRIASAYLAGAPELVDTLEQVVGEVQEALGWV